MSQATCQFCPQTARIDSMNLHMVKHHHDEMMADVSEEMARYAINHKTPVIWKKEGNKLAYAYCLTCKKVSMGDCTNFKNKHITTTCKGGWETYKDQFLSKAPSQEEEVRNEIVGSTEIPNNDAIYKAMLLEYNPDFDGTIQEGIKGLVSESQRRKPELERLENRISTLEREKIVYDRFKEKMEGDYNHAMKVIDKYAAEIFHLKSQSGIEEERKKQLLEGQELRKALAEVRQTQNERDGRWTEIGEERAIAVEELKKEKAKFEQKEKEWKKEKKELVDEKKEVEEQLEELQDKYKKLRRSQKESD